MDYPNIPSLTQRWRRLSQHQLQWYRWVLGRISLYHFGILYIHSVLAWATTAWLLGPSPVRPLGLHLVAVLLSAAARLCWSFLFRDPAQFAGLMRPGWRYRWTVIIACGITTVPNWCVHLVLLAANFRGVEEEGASLMDAKLGFILSVLQIGLLTGACTLCAWMIWRFLADEEDEMFDPCARSELNAKVIRGAVEEPGPAQELYSDTPYSPVRHGQGTAAIDFLGVAYTKQRVEASAAEQEPDRSSQPYMEEHGETTPKLHNASTTDVSISPQDWFPTPLRCPTVARYEYMDKNHIGAHSYLSYPVMPAIILTYNSILSIPMVVFIIETQHLSKPSPKARRALLYTLLGSCILCFYALKHRLRRSMFESFELPLPDPWNQGSSPIRGRSQFQRPFAEELATLDPRLRAFPTTASFNPTSIRTKEYMRAYNAHSSPCHEYWGHQGRQWTSTSRIIPTVLRVGFIASAVLLYLYGVWCIYSFPSPFGMDSEDPHRQDRIVYWKMLLAIFIIPQVTINVVYAVMSAGSMLMLCLKCLLKYEEMKDHS